MKQFLLLASLPCLLFAAPGITEDEGIRRVHAHLLIDDASSALREAEELFDSFPGSRAIGSAYIEALSANGLEEKALRVWNALFQRYPDLINDRTLLEELAWGVLKKGVNATQFAVRLASLIGSYLTRDVRAVKILLRMMRDSNAIIRSIAVQMATGFADAPLKDEISRLMVEEKIWFVRLEVIKAVGALRLKELAPKLQAIIASEKNTYEERQLAIEALVTIYDQVNLEEIETLSKSNRAGMRHLACMLASHFQLEAAKEQVIRLVFDAHPGVRVAALNAIGLVYLNQMEKVEAKNLVETALQDANPAAAITASWLASLIDPAFGTPHLERWIKSDQADDRRLAASALSATGGRCIELAKKILKESADPYVRANVAMGLIGQRLEVASCCDILYDFMMQEKRMWMWDNRANPLFRVLAPSQVRHVDQIPNYPEAIDQMTRLNLVSLLALVNDPRAQEALKSFLQRKTWGITGVAAATLLQEGDESALEVVRSLVNDPDPNVRLQASLVLAMLGRDESVIFDLQKAYVQSDHERKLHILEAMGNIGNAESFSFFVSVLEEPFQILRVAAAAGLIQSVNR